jgi:hypothetical protein
LLPAHAPAVLLAALSPGGGFPEDHRNPHEGPIEAICSRHRRLLQPVRKPSPTAPGTWWPVTFSPSTYAKRSQPAGHLRRLLYYNGGHLIDSDMNRPTVGVAGDHREGDPGCWHRLPHQEGVGISTSVCSPRTRNLVAARNVDVPSILASRPKQAENHEFERNRWLTQCDTG